LTRRRFNSLFDRIDRHTDFTEALDVSAHWIRHTTLADIAAVSDLRVAAAYAGHSTGSLGVIGRYTAVTFEDLQDAYRAVFGGP
jgi:site-specific recombinase XerD